MDIIEIVHRALLALMASDSIFFEFQFKVMLDFYHS